MSLPSASTAASGQISFSLGLSVPWPLPISWAIFDDLNLARKDITWLPDDLVVTGNMDISCCTKLFFLPANLTVCGNLNIMYTPIRRVPADLKVYGNIIACNMDLDIPNGYTVNGDLYLSSGGAAFPEALDPLLHLPDDLAVNGILDIRGRRLAKVPKNLTLKSGLAIGPWVSTALTPDNVFFKNGIVLSGLSESLIY